MKLKSHATLMIFLTLTVLISAFSWTDNIVFTDEILFEEAAYQMWRTGDFVTPRQGNEVWLEKPPLYFWLTALTYRVFPPTPFARRLVTLVSAAATVALTYALARRFVSQQTARWSMIVLTTAPLFFFFTKAANLDIPATMLILATILAYEKAKVSPRWLWVAGVSFGLGILTRSFLALTPIPVIFLDRLLERRKMPAKYLALSLALALALALPWHLLVWKAHPLAFARDYIRFNVADHLMTQTPGHESLSPARFLFDVLLKLNPASLLVLGNLLSASRRNRNQSRLLIIWAAASLIPLTLATTRHEWYAIQALPPMAILSSQGLTRIQGRLKAAVNPKRWEVVVVFAIAALITLPTTVFRNILKETKSIATLRRFIASTPDGTPLYNLEHLYVPQSTLYNPRDTPVIFQDELGKIKIPIYLYLNSREQYETSQPILNRCCDQEMIAEDVRGALILYLTPKANEKT